MVDFRLLGSLELVADDGSTVLSVLAQPKRLAILAYLALATPRGFHRRDTLLALFWPDSDEARARGSLNQALYHLRRSLGDDLLPSRGDEEVGLAWERWTCDVVEFRSLVAADRLQEALRLYRGELLPGFGVDASVEFEQWLDGERRAIRSAANAAAAALGARADASGDGAAALEWLRRARAIDPFDADHVYALMQRLHRSGHTMAALTEYEEFAALVAADLDGTPPEPLSALARRLRSAEEPAPAPAIRGAAEAADCVPETVLSESTTTAAAPVRSSALDRLFRRRKRTIAIGAAAVLLLCASLVFYANGRKAVRADVDVSKELVLSDFVNRTDEENLSEGITEALRIDLEQSRFLTLASTPRVQEALRRMDRPADTRLTAEVARELALREGLEVVLTGEVAALGSRYLITAQLVTADSGAVVLSHRERASGPDEVIPAVDRLSEWLRRRMGESLRELRQNEPLEAVTTHSLEALKAYSAAFKPGMAMGNDRTIQLLERAIAVDSTFASAYRSLGVWLYWRGGQQARVDEVLTRSYELRHRLSVRERLLAEGTYHHFVTRDYDRAIGVFQQMLDRDPRDYAPLDHLAFLYFRRRDFERAIDMHQRLALVNRTSRPAANYFFSLAGAGRIADAETLLVEQATRDTTSYKWLVMLAAFRADRGDFAAADSLARRAVRLSANAGNSLAYSESLEVLGALRILRGAYAEGSGLMRKAADLHLQTGTRSRELYLAAQLARFDLLVAHAPERAKRRLDSALVRVPLRSLAPADRPYVLLAGSYAWLGDTARATALLQGYDESSTANASAVETSGIHVVRALLRAHQGRFAEAWAAFEQGSLHGFCYRCLLPAKATLYELEGRPDSAMVAWEEFLANPYTDFAVTSFFLAHAYERLAQLHDQAGRPERAAVYYRKLLDLWTEPDPALRPRWEAARSRLSVLAIRPSG